MASILNDSVTWDSRDFDPDLKASAVSLAINLCIYEGSDEANGQRKAVKMLVNNERMCATLKKYILGRNKDEQVPSPPLTKYGSRYNKFVALWLHELTSLPTGNRAKCSA